MKLDKEIDIEVYELLKKIKKKLALTPKENINSKRPIVHLVPLFDKGLSSSEDTEKTKEWLQLLHKLEELDILTKSPHPSPDAPIGKLEHCFYDGYDLHINMTKFKQLYAKHESKKQLSKISYNKESGIGYVDGKRFKFKDHKPEYKVFLELYENINKRVLRKKVLELIGVSKDDDNISRKLNTETINELTKEIRKRTSLDTNTLALNNGNLTLTGKKIEFEDVVKS